MEIFKVTFFEIPLLKKNNTDLNYQIFWINILDPERIIIKIIWTWHHVRTKLLPIIRLCRISVSLNT